MCGVKEKEEPCGTLRFGPSDWMVVTFVNMREHGEDGCVGEEWESECSQGEEGRR
jgi:hypothetical protein